MDEGIHGPSSFSVMRREDSLVGCVEPPVLKSASDLNKAKQKAEESNVLSIIIPITEKNAETIKRKTRHFGIIF